MAEKGVVDQTWSFREINANSALVGNILEPALSLSDGLLDTMSIETDSLLTICSDTGDFIYFLALQSLEK